MVSTKPNMFHLLLRSKWLTAERKRIINLESDHEIKMYNTHSCTYQHNNHKCHEHHRS